MGEARISIHISRSLSSAFDDPNASQFATIVVNVSADTTIRELFENTTLCGCDGTITLLSIVTTTDCSDGDGVSVWDCTIHPPKNITNWPVIDYPNKSGLKSKTLYDAGWFPSGRLFVLAGGVDIVDAFKSSDDKYHDVQYNSSDTNDHNRFHFDGTQTSRSRVQLVGADSSSDTPLPSHVLNAVTKRFDNDDGLNNEQVLFAAKAEQQKNRLELAAKGQARNKKLDDRIMRLEKQSSGDTKKNNKAVSEQVQRMLIKSRASGRPELKQQDRLYFRLLVVDSADDDDDGGDAAGKLEYRYFSPQDTVGKIASSVFNDSTTVGSKQSELLVRLPIEDSAAGNFEYKRLPKLMRLYEAMSSGLLLEFDKIIIRVFVPRNEAPTPLVSSETTGDAPAKIDLNKPENTSTDDMQEESVAEGNSGIVDQTGVDTATDSAAYNRLREQLCALDKKGQGKKLSATAVKVRQMQMKSKAKGDLKRIKLEDRFYIELVTSTAAATDDGDPKLTLAPVFLGKFDPIERLLTDCAHVPARLGWSHEFLVVATGNAFRKVADTSMSFGEAEQRGILKCFDQVILRLFSST